MSFQKLSEILSKVAGRYTALSKSIKEDKALSRWETGVSPAIANHTRAIQVQDGVLWVEVDHPIRRTELHYRKRQILEALNKGIEAKSPEIHKDLLLLDPRGDRP